MSIDDVWTALLSDDEAELEAAEERIAADPTMSAIAADVLTAPEPADPDPLACHGIAEHADSGFGCAGGYR